MGYRVETFDGCVYIWELEGGAEDPPFQILPDSASAEALFLALGAHLGHPAPLPGWRVVQYERENESGRVLGKIHRNAEGWGGWLNTGTGSAVQFARTADAVAAALETDTARLDALASRSPETPEPSTESGGADG